MVLLSGSLGRIYYDTGTSKLRLYNGAWVDIQTGTVMVDTTYELFATLVLQMEQLGIQLDGTINWNYLIMYYIVGAGTVGVTRSGNYTYSYF